MRFSQRIGKGESKHVLQIESMDDTLRTGLWNVVFRHALSETDLPHTDGAGGPDTCLLKEIWSEVLARPRDEIPASSDKVAQEIKTWFFKAQWYEAYDFVEFIAHVGGNVYDRYGVASLEMGENGCRPLGGPVDTDSFKQECNAVLERNSSGYRFVGNEIAPITNEIEIAAVEESMDTTVEHALAGANEHLNSALDKLSDKRRPDYRNSVKESISAVESLCRILSGDRRTTLPEAIKALKDKGIAIHPALEQGIIKIYGYTSDDDGIRHSMTDNSACDLDEAKYMLVSCSAFVNYLIGKASKVDLLK